MATKQDQNAWKTSEKVMLGFLIFQIIVLLMISAQIGSLSSSFASFGKEASALQKQEASPPAPLQAPSPSPTQQGIDMKALSDDDPFKGDENAPVVIVEWSDFECPFCGRFYRDTLSQIEDQYVATGKVKFVYRDFPLASIHQYALKAAEAANCANEQGKFWEMHDLLFEKGVNGGVPEFKNYASQLGLDTAAFNDCFDNGKYIQEIQKDINDAAQVGIRGTPGFIINGQLVSGALPFSSFQQAIEAALKQ